MNPKQLAVYRRSKDQLRSSSENLYLRTMGELFKTYESFEFVRILQGHFRSRRYDLALRFADSLSEQKYSDATIHFVANQFATLVRKYPWDPKIVKTDPRGKAIATFLKAERKCARLNRKFKLYGNYRSPFEYQLNEMRNFISYVLGIEPNISKILDQCNFGSGASIGIHGSATHLARKILAKEWSVSPSASAIALRAISKNFQLVSLLLPSRNYINSFDTDAFVSAYVQKRALVDYNKISFVPKTASTFRAIAVEPLLNGFVQKGADLEMRKRLKRVGIDLTDQSKNQRMARLGSLDDSDEGFVTIDLSSASDSISIGLVASILPRAWFEFLDSIRSKMYELDGKHYAYHKFCSMGNGFCFPLESLLFAACCKACDCGTPGTDFSVYGDDIIVRKKHALKVLNLLHIMGFKANSRKTFITGPFRESCGSDWFGGLDVRPYTLDHKLDSIESLYKWLNLTRRSTLTEHFFAETRDLIMSQIPVQFRFLRPYKGNADSGIDCTADEYLSSPHVHFDKRCMRWFWKELLHTPVSERRSRYDGYQLSQVDMYALLCGSVSRDYKVEYSLRRKTRTTVRMVSHSGATSQWTPRTYRR